MDAIELLLLVGILIVVPVVIGHAIAAGTLDDDQ